MRPVLLPIYLLLICLQCLRGSNVNAQSRVLVNESFNGSPTYFNLSLLTLWGSHQQPVSAFIDSAVSDTQGNNLNCITLSNEAMRNSGFTTANSLKTCTAIDWKFPYTIDRDRDTVIAEFDTYWDTLFTNGENGRIVMALMYNYPAQYPALGMVDSVLMDHPFGRPAYNFRILNRASVGTGGFLFYGGGADARGEVEKTSGWWLPGFIAQPPGVAPGSGSNYPLSPNIDLPYGIAEKRRWTHITMVLMPETLELYKRYTGSPESSNQRLVRMFIPKLNQGSAVALQRMQQFYGSSVTTLPTLYNWFPSVNALRFYFRGANFRSYLSNMQVRHSAVVPPLLGEQALLKTPLLYAYPNPAEDAVFLNNESALQYEILDLGGRVLSAGTLNPQEAIQLGELKSGLYLLKVYQHGRNTQVLKISKQ